MPVDFRRLIDGLTATAELVNAGMVGIPAIIDAIETGRAVTEAAGATFTEYGPGGGRVVAATGEMAWALGQPVAGTFIPEDVPRIWAGRVEVLPADLAQPLLNQGMRRMVGGRVDAGERTVGSVHLYFGQPWGEVDQDLVTVIKAVAATIGQLYVDHPTAPATKERLDDDRELFLAVAGHELRTPVTVIKGYAGTLADRWEDLDERARRQAAGVLAQRADELARLVDRFLSAAGGAVAEEWLARAVPFDLLEALRRAESELPTAQRDHLRWLLPPVLAPAFGDPAAVGIVLGELITNAVKHGSAGPGPLVIDVAAGEDEQTVFFRVIDHGPGIDPANAERAFERFWQAQPPGPDRRGGVGLGLYLVRRIVERQNGWVSLRSGDGRGTVAEVRLPRAESPVRRAAPGEA
jgi:signal transduction histidine kinase